MNSELLGILSLICLVVSSLWLVFLISDIRMHGAVTTFEQALTYISRRGRLFFLSYLNAALITVVTTMLFAGLYVYFRTAMPEWAFIAVVFVPAYSVLNLACYLSQITIIPRLLAFRDTAENRAQADLLIGQMTQAWPGSAVAVLNGLAYAILGIPSIIFGLSMLDEGSPMPVAGVLLALSGVASTIGFAGLILHSMRIGLGLAVGGALYTVALIPLAIAFLRM